MSAVFSSYVPLSFILFKDDIAEHNIIVTFFKTDILGRNQLFIRVILSYHTLTKTLV